MSLKRDSKLVLEGLSFAISGKLSIGRNQFEELIKNNGGIILKSITKSCTHLISSEIGTEKYQEALEKGIQIVDEDWIRNKINGEEDNDENDDDDESIPKKKMKNEKSSDNESESNEFPLAGLCFAITGKLSQPRAEFEKYIKENGGTIAKSITKSCTHLISSETETAKCRDAEAKGIEIVDEDWVIQKVERTNNNNDEDDDDDDDDDSHKGRGDEVDLTGTELELTEPPYSREFRRKFREIGPQFTSLVAVGDWEAWLKDLIIIIPYLVNLKKVRLQAYQCGCEGLVDVIEILNNCEHLEECDFSDSFAHEPMDTIGELILSHPNLRLLDLSHEADKDTFKQNEIIVVTALKNAFEKYRSSYKLEKFEGFPLSKPRNLKLLGLEDQVSLIGQSNSDVLLALRTKYQEI